MSNSICENLLENEFALCSFVLNVFSESGDLDSTLEWFLAFLKGIGLHSAQRDHSYDGDREKEQFGRPDVTLDEARLIVPFLGERYG